MAGDWWTGSPSGGAERALSMGMAPVEGMTQEQKNAYRMAPGKRDPLTWWQDQPAPGTTKDELLAGWQKEAAGARAAQQAQGQADWRTRMERGMATLMQKKKRKKAPAPTAKDAGDALARYDDEMAELNRLSGIG